MTFESAPLGISALITHARYVSSEAREQFATAAAHMDDPRAILVHTCHRVEVYVVADDREACPRSIELPALPAGGRRLEDGAAVRHLLSVAAGLDSTVLGEDQILHQLRACLTTRRGAAGDPGHAGEAAGAVADEPGAGELHATLERLFQVAMRVGRQARAWREGPPRSLADVALDRIEADAGPIAGKAVLVVGAGSMSRLSVQAAARRGARVQVTNRTIERAAALAADVAGEAVPFGKLGDTAPGAVIAAVSGRWSIDEEAVRSLEAGRAVVVDLSSPPAIPARLRDALGSRLVSVDDLARGPEAHVRARVLRRVEHLLDEAEAEFERWMGARRSVPAIQALTERAERRRAAEVDRLLRRLPELPERQRELVEQMSQRLVAGLLHAPLATLRDDQDGERERAARELFAL